MLDAIPERAEEIKKLKHRKTSGTHFGKGAPEVKLTLLKLARALVSC